MVVVRVSAGGLAGLREVRDQTEIDVAAGEYGYIPSYLAAMIAAGAVDCLQVDATRCGGYTDWLGVAYLAAAHGLAVSGHCAPNVHAHVATAAPNLRHLEYFHDHSRIEGTYFEGALSPHGSALTPRSDAAGMAFRASDAAEHRIA